jgi:hypothetical protein
MLIDNATVDETHQDDLRNCLINLLASIELHTDCMDGRIDRAALDPWIEKAEDILQMRITEMVE